MIDVLFFLNFEQCALNIHNDNFIDQNRAISVKCLGGIHPY